MCSDLSTQLSIITVNYNGLCDTLELLISLRKTVTSVRYETIVIDNGSTQDESLVIRESHPWAKVIRSEKNLGFAGGNNLGLKYAQGAYILLLNNDTLITEDFLAQLIDRMDQNPNIGALSPKLRFFFGDQHIQYAGCTPLSRITLRNCSIGYDEADEGQYDQFTLTAFAHGAAMLVKREVIETAGLMPENFFLYYEEFDWCDRIKDAGYEIAYDPQMIVWHKESQSTGQNSPFKEYYLTRNRLLYAYRNRNGYERILSIAYQVGVNLVRVIQDVCRWRMPYLKARVNGVIDFTQMQKKK